jgi:ATP-dependent helicase HrpB
VIDFTATGLPIVPYLPRISELLARHRGLALTAEPGAGKSTLVPPALMDEPWLGGRAIIMLEPRRLAAVAAATRIAELLGEPVGRRAGYRVRTSTRVSGETRIEVVTEALLTRRIQEDPLLSGVGLVILDEFHERSLHADLALALALEVRRARPDLAVMAMSATLDTEAVAGLLGGPPGNAREQTLRGQATGPQPAGDAREPAPTLHCPGAVHPVRTEHRPLPPAGRWEEGFADGVQRLLGETDGDILAFLPGAAEIRRVQARLAGSLGAAAECLPLHGTMRLEDQTRIIRAERGAGGGEGRGADMRSGGRDRGVRRVILATSIAETSLTVPGIRTVADSGWARLSRFHPATGLDRLVTERVSASSAEQRRGRAGRLGPGLCVRFWPETERLPSRPEPEILRSDLSGLVLECALWGVRPGTSVESAHPGGVRGANELRWLDPPPASAWAQAWEILRMLGLVDGDGPTVLGREVAGLGLAPRLGALVIHGAALGQADLAVACAALLQERDGIPRSGAGGADARDPDFRLRLELVRLGGARPSTSVEAARPGGTRPGTSEDIARPGGARPGTETWQRSVALERARILRRLGADRGGPREWTEEQEQRVGSLLAAGFPDRLARKEPDGTYRLVTGRVARFPSHGPGAHVSVASRAAGAWVVVLDADPGEVSGLIRLAAPVEKDEAEAVLARAAEETVEIRWEGLVPKAALVRRVGRFVLTERPARPPTGQTAASFRDLLVRQGLAVLPWNSQSTRLLARMRFFARARPDQGLGDLSDEGLAGRAGEWLVPFLKLSSGQVLGAAGLHSALLGLLGSARGRFAHEVPESIVLPTGGRRQVDYATAEPAVEARIQEVFGLAESPRVCGVPLTFRLLSPAQRPLQITRDLASFWSTTYAEVRREMRGRYPKHYWPENPLDAEPPGKARR